MNGNGRGDSLTPIVGAAMTTLSPAAVAYWAAPPDGVTFSAAGLTIIALLLGALASVVTVLHRELMRAKDAQITRLEARDAELMRLLSRATMTTDTSLKLATGEREPV